MYHSSHQPFFIPPKIQEMIKGKEKILWSGKPNLRATVIPALILSLPFIIGLITAIGSGEVTADLKEISANLKLDDNLNGALTFGFLAILITLGFYIFHRITHYFICSERIIFKWGPRIKSIYYSEIRSSYVKRGIFGRLFGTGTILIDNGEVAYSKKGGSSIQYTAIRNILDSHQVYKTMQKASQDMYANHNSNKNNPPPPHKKPF